MPNDAEIIASLQAQLAQKQEQLDAHTGTISALRDLSTRSDNSEVIPGFDHAQTLSIKAAGVDADDLLWRIRAGLSFSQALEVAAEQKRMDAQASA